MSGSPTLIGRYEVRQKIGQGGMGAIYLARDPVIDRLVAVKVLNPSITSDDLRQRFAQEARASGALSHPNIVTIHDYGEFDGAPFIVMEYVQGDTMAEVIKRGIPLPTARKLRWMEQVCRALRYAHDHRVIHRDVKPSNLMIDKYDMVKVVDFGIARLVGEGLTKMSMVIGTPGYMSPEQLRGGTIDARSDVFSVGAVMYELLSYHEAFSGETPHAIMHKVVTAEPPPLIDLVVGPDLTIIDVVDRALQKSADARYRDMAELEQAVKRARMALEAAESDVQVKVPPRPAADRHKSRRRWTDPVEIARRRAELIDKHLQEARRAQNNGDLDDAIAACEEALLMDPSSMPALNLLEALRHESSGSIPVPRPAPPAPPAPVPAPAPPAARMTVQEPRPAAPAPPSPPPPTRERSRTVVEEPKTRPVPAMPLGDIELLPSAAAPARPAPRTPVVPLDPPSLELRPAAAIAAAKAASQQPSPAATRSTRKWIAGAGVLAVVALGTWIVRSDILYGGPEEEAPELAMPAVPEATPAESPRSAPGAGRPPRTAAVAPSPSTEPTPADPAAAAPPAAVEPTPASPPASAPAVAEAAPTPPEPAPPSEKAAPSATPPETVEKDAAAAAPDTPVSRSRREVGRLLLLAEAAESGGNPNDALAHYREVLQIEAKNVIALRGVTRIRVGYLLRRAESQILVGDYEGALNDINTALADDPKNPRAAELRQAIEQGKKTLKKPQ